MRDPAAGAVRVLLFPRESPDDRQLPLRLAIERRRKSLAGLADRWTREPPVLPADFAEQQAVERLVAFRLPVPEVAGVGAGDLRLEEPVLLAVFYALAVDP